MINDINKGRKAQQSVIGFALVILIVSFGYTALQLNVAPQFQENAEKTHAIETIRDIQNIREGIYSASSGSTELISVKMGGVYPSLGGILVQPRGFSGQIYSNPSSKIKIKNIQAKDKEERDGIDASSSSIKIDSNYIVFSPNYRQRKDKKISIEPGIVVNRNGIISSQSVVNGRNIKLIGIGGDIDKGSRNSILVGGYTLSGSRNDIIVEAVGSPEITIPTKDPDMWQKLLKNEKENGGCSYDSDNKFVCNIILNPDRVTIKLESNTYYRLDMSMVAVQTTSSSLPSSNFKVYIRGVDGRYSRTISENGVTPITVRVLDRFGNPVGGVKVEASATETKGINPATQIVTNEDGKATFYYQAPEIPQNNAQETETVTIEISDVPQNPDVINPQSEKVEYEITVTNS